MQFTLYTEEECVDAMGALKDNEICNRLMTFAAYGALEEDNLTPGAVAFQQAQNNYPEKQGKAVNEYMELAKEDSIGCRLSLRFMARIIAYLRVNGGFTIVQTQELGNCLYAAFLRGTAAKREVTSMHVRRMLVMMITKNFHFFFEYLKVPLSKHYGHERIAPELLDQQEREGTCTEAYARDQRLPGPFSLLSYCKHLLTNKTWGDDLVLTLLSCMFQISITSLDAKTLGERRIRHDLPLKDVNLVVVFAEGDHFMGTGEYRLSVPFQQSDH